MFPPARPEGVAEAADGLAPNKASGQDGFPAVTFARIPQPYHLQARPYTDILLTGNFPELMLDLISVPLGKPNKPPEAYRESKPIPLICAASQTF